MSNQPDQPQEYVLVIPRTELTKQGINYSGVQNIDLEQIASENFGFLPRTLIDDKSKTSIEIGKLLPQVLPYFIIKDEDGRILSYARKGKEEGLLGKRSIGVGGHIDLNDAIVPPVEANILNGLGNHYKHITHIIMRGLVRELEEEIGLKLNGAIKFDHVISIDSDKTSQVHIALVTTIQIPTLTLLTPAADEFLDIKHLTWAELAEHCKDVEYEPWSQLLIDHYA